MTTTDTAPVRPVDIRDAYLGRNAYGERVFVDIRLVLVAPRGQTTVDHDPVTDPFWMVGISGSAIEKGRRDASSWGQIVDAVRGVRRRYSLRNDPAPAVSDADIRRLADIWDRWHLNDMKAGCRHHVAVPRDSSLGSTVEVPSVGDPCPITGYRYGSAWLIEPLPADVAADVYRIASALVTSQTPAR